MPRHPSPVITSPVPRPLHVAYGLMACFILAERLLRQGNEATSLQEGPADRGSTRAVGTAFGVGLLVLLVAPLLNRLRVGRVSIAAPAWGGVVGMTCGLALRVWAARVLGASYTRTLRTTAGQRIVQEGPYRLVRHPGYLSSLLLWFGAAMATANWIAAIAIVVPIARAYRLRVEAEEVMLAEAFGEEYRRYATRTRRLIPFIY